jgi:hypothetical protein
VTPVFIENRSLNQQSAGTKNYANYTATTATIAEIAVAELTIRCTRRRISRDASISSLSFSTSS